MVSVEEVRALIEEGRVLEEEDPAKAREKYLRAERDMDEHLFRMGIARSSAYDIAERFRPLYSEITQGYKRISEVLGGCGLGV